MDKSILSQRPEARKNDFYEFLTCFLYRFQSITSQISFLGFWVCYGATNTKQVNMSCVNLER